MDGRQAIFDWSQTLTPWHQDLLRRVAAHDASDQDCAEVLDLLLKEHGLAPAAAEALPLQLTDLPEDVPTAAETLLEIGECSNVNAIDSKEPLTFEPSGITLVYGENATGKTGYTRIIKRVARSVHEEVVLPNVFAGVPQGPPRAVIEVEDKYGRTKHIAPLDRVQPLLRSVTVFDAQCATVYLRNAKTVEFTPAPLRVFGRAASAQRRVRELLDARIATMRGKQPSLDEFPRGTRVRALLDSISSSESAEELGALADVSEDEARELGKLRLELASAEAGTAAAQARQRERDAEAFEALAGQLEAIDTALSAEQRERLRKARDRVREAEQAVSAARSTGFANELLPATGSQGWRAMWEAARSFVERECPHDFPPIEDGDICPLCQQTLSAVARTRLERFEQFVRGTLEQELASASEELRLAEASNPLEQITTAWESPALQALDDDEPEVATAARKWLSAARLRANAFAQGGVSRQALDGCPSVPVKEVARDRKDEAKRQRQSIDPDRQQKVRQAVAELEARIRLGQRLSEFLDWHKTATTIAALYGIRAPLDTAGLSNKLTELANTLVTEELRRSVRSELDALGFAHLKVALDCRTERGMTVARMGLDGASEPIAAVFSDGEQRSCAMAFFLAEALASPSEGGIVFDDPASSLDVERIEHIGSRIVELAKKRKQIIVLSHNLVFAWFLQDAAERAGVGFSVRSVSRIGDRAGIVRTGKSWPGERLSGRLTRLRQTLTSLEALFHQGNVDAYEPAAKTFAGDLRETWERAVEEGLFKKVVMRFQRDVKALHIRDVVVTSDLTKEIFDGMTETSPYHHSSALAKPTPTPSIEDLRRFLARLEQFCTAVKQKPVSAPAATASEAQTGLQPGA